jgi:cullin-associated NEDD8-dissociated protein 1
MAEFALLLNESDLHIAQLTLVLLTSIGLYYRQSLADIERLGIMAEVKHLLRSPLLQGAALDSMLNFFRVLAAAQLPGLGFSELLKSLFSFVQSPNHPVLNRQVSLFNFPIASVIN